MDGCAMLTNVNGQLLLLKKEKVWQRERIIITQSIALHHVSLSTLDFSVFVI